MRQEGERIRQEDSDGLKRYDVREFDIASKQALLEAPSLSDRADLLIQLLRFFRDQDDAQGGTLQ